MSNNGMDTDNTKDEANVTQNSDNNASSTGAIMVGKAQKNL